MSDSGFSNWAGIIAVVFGIGSAIVAGIVSWTKTMGKTQNKQSVTTTVIENAVKQLQELKTQLSELREDLHQDRIQRTRLEERILYVQKQLDDLSTKLERQARL